MTQATISEPVLELVKRLPELRPFPQVAARLLAACQQADTTAGDLAEIIQCDPAVSSRLLNVANSPMYGFSGDIRTVDHAVVILGFRAVRDLGVSMAAADVFAQGDTAVQCRSELWQHSLGCAAVAKLLASHVGGVQPEEAFLAGIVHDVGKLLLFDAYADEYAAATCDLNSATIIDVEKQLYGVSHTEVGFQCALTWGLPLGINQAISFHHSPQSAEASPELVAVVGAANALSRQWQIGFDHAVAEEPIESLSDAWPELTDEALEQIRGNAPAEFESIRQVCAP